MKKNILFFVCFLLVVVNAYADQTLNGRQPREWDHSVDSKQLEGKDYTDNTTTYANQLNTGNNATGNAGYQALLAVDSIGTIRTYYLWVDASSTSVGVLKMASFASIKNYSSFPYGDWRSSTGFGAGIKVSSQ